MIILIIGIIVAIVLIRLWIKGVNRFINFLDGNKVSTYKNIDPKELEPRYIQFDHIKDPLLDMDINELLDARNKVRIIRLLGNKSKVWCDFKTKEIDDLLKKLS
ncbi:hypothetical protein N9H19_00880 [Flavobacteriales bacterium]|nr:hypothetical protein [Flavobacteriales bacterium]